jgi:hypothetical protein
MKPPRPESTETTPGLFAQVLDHLGALVRNEVDLARAEIAENLGRAGTALMLLLAAVIVALVALDVLAAAAVVALAEVAELSAGWSALIIGGVLILLAVILGARAMRDLKPENLAPRRTVRSLRADAETAKETFHV